MAKKFKFRWRENGRHRQKTFPTKAHRDAFSARVQLGQHEPTGSTVTLQEFVEKWLKTPSPRGVTTRLKDKAVTTRHLVPALGHIPLAKLRAPHLLELRDHLCRQAGRQGKPLAPKSVNCIMGVAKNILATAVEWELIGTNPWAKVGKLREDPKAIDFLTADEKGTLLTFLAEKDPDLYELVYLGLETGLRRGELQALQRGQLCFTTRQIRVDATYSEHLKERLPRTKGREIGYVPMANDVYGLLRSRETASMDAYVFSRRLFVDIYDRLQRRCRDAGIRPIGIHTLRHTFASSRVMAGVPLYTVQRLMRHKSIAMTERYAHLAPDYLRGEIERGCAPFVRGATLHSAQAPDSKGRHWRPLRGSKSFGPD